jgi:uncharacterized protein (TIGR02271 family)
VSTTNSPTVVALFNDETQAQQALNALQQAGFRGEQISYSGHGTSKGSFLAGLKSLFTGDDTTTGTHNAYKDLLGMGFSEQDARYYQQEYENGRSIISVAGASNPQGAATLLAQYGGYGPTRRADQAAGYDTAATTRAAGQTAGYDTAATASSRETAADTSTDEGRRMQLREEQLRVGKQTVQAGEVGLHKEVVSEQQSVDVPVTHEEVVIERRPGSGQPSDVPIGAGETYRVPVSAEQVSVQKQQVVREEITLGKQQVQDSQQVSDTVRREEARVDRKGDAIIQGDDTVGQ